MKLVLVLFVMALGGNFATAAESREIEGVFCGESVATQGGFQKADKVMGDVNVAITKLRDEGKSVIDVKMTPIVYSHTTIRRGVQFCITYSNS